MTRLLTKAARKIFCKRHPEPELSRAHVAAALTRARKQRERKFATTNAMRAYLKLKGRLA